MAPVGILLLNLGGPDSLEAVEPFLYNLFSDREIIALPGGPAVQPLFARLIARVRGPAVRRNYAGIGGRSPILELTNRQASALEAELNRREPGAFRTGVAMRYWKPDTDTALRAMLDSGITRILALTLYPQFSAATTGSSLNELRRALARAGHAAAIGGPGSRAGNAVAVTAIDRYPTHPLYLEAIAGTVEEALRALPEEARGRACLLFSAHGLPMKFIRAGDPYVDEIARTRDGVLEILRARGWANPWKLGYQSRTGPVRWIGPYTDEVIEELAAEGMREVVVIPIAFVSDHIETLYEIDQLFADLARSRGIERFVRTRMLNDDPAFIRSLAALVQEHLAAETGAGAGDGRRTGPEGAQQHA